jgi:hypothetical protein
VHCEGRHLSATHAEQMTEDPLEPPSWVDAVCSLADESRERLQIDLWAEPEPSTQIGAEAARL